MKNICYLIALLVVGGLSSCFTSLEGDSQGLNVDAYVPIYGSTASTESISAVDGRTTTKAGKIYATNRYIFQNDLQTGIHVIDRTTTPPQKVAFINILFSSDFAVRGNWLYVNSSNDLLTIDISDLKSPVLKSKIPNVFGSINQEVPPQFGYFVCPDKSKGPIVYWELHYVEKALCRR